MSFDEIVHCLSAEDQKTVREMTALFESIGRQTRQFAAETGLKCETGCGTCCANPDIETTVAEVLPLAVYLWSISQADDALRTRPSAGACVFYKPDPAVKGHGRCGIYAYRPGLCRLFGFAANRDKYGRRTLATCKVIRESQAQACAHGLSLKLVAILKIMESFGTRTSAGHARLGCLNVPAMHLLGGLRRQLDLLPRSQGMRSQ